SYFSDVIVFGFREIPFTFMLDCNPASPFFDAGLCGGEVGLFGQVARHVESLEPGESKLVNFSVILGDFDRRSQGLFNLSGLVTNVGSGDFNLTNNARIVSLGVNGTLVVQPSKVELNHHFGGRLDSGNLGISVSNPLRNISRYSYEKWNGGGRDSGTFNVLLYLDNNDSSILSSFDDSIKNHSSIFNTVDYDWGNISEGDHIVYSYLDYGFNNSESTAFDKTLDNLTFIAATKGIRGNNIAVRIENDTSKVTDVLTFEPQNGNMLELTSTAGLFVGHIIMILDPGEKPSVFNFATHEITNIAGNNITITPSLTRNVGAGYDVWKVLGTFKVTVTTSQEYVNQTEFDVEVKTNSTAKHYIRLADNATKIKTISNVVNALTNGGFNTSDDFINNSMNLFTIDTSNADVTKTPTSEQSTLILRGSVEERSEFNNVNSVVFRWKEIVASGINFVPPFPLPNDLVTVTASISNNGDIRTGDFKVAFFVDGVLTEVKTISLLQGQSQAVSFNYRIPSDISKKSINVLIIADSEDVIHREDETNNDLSATIPISKPIEFNIMSKEYDINFLSPYENNATNFTSAVLGLPNLSFEYDAAPTLFDYDNDGDLDLLVGSLDGKIRSFRNNGFPTIPDLNEITEWNDFDASNEHNVNIGGKFYTTTKISQIDIGARSSIDFADLDGDGLTDMLLGTTHGFLKPFKRVLVQEQIFNATTNSLQNVNRNAWIEFSFNLSGREFPERTSPRLADLNNDKDFDLVIGNVIGNLIGFENIGNVSNPIFSPNTWNLENVSIEGDSSPEFIDLDNDNDKDLLVGGFKGVEFFENTGNSSSPQWRKLNKNITIPEKIVYKPTAGDLDGDGDADLVIGSNDANRIDLRRGYSEPVKIQIVNLASNQIFIDRVEISAFNKSNGKRITELLTWGPFQQNLNTIFGDGCILRDTTEFADSLEAFGVLEKEFNVNIPSDFDNNTFIGATATKKDRVGGFYKLAKTGRCAPYRIDGGSMPSLPYVFNATLGGCTFDLFVDPESVYEIGGSYRLRKNGTLTEPVICRQQMCPLFGLVPGEVNKIVKLGGDGDIYKYQKIFRDDFDVVIPSEPALLLEVVDKFEVQL
ncbi:MAG: FG-GAP-like repeat-containing protein, partial [Nanoarchaeota archaeon]